MNVEHTNEDGHTPRAIEANPFERCKERVDLGTGEVQIYLPARLSDEGYPDVALLPVSLRIILESMLRNADGLRVTERQVRDLAEWKPDGKRTGDVPFVVGRIVLNDMAGIPLLGDLAAMRSAALRAGISPEQVKPKVAQVDMVIDHTLSVDFHGEQSALEKNMKIEMERNRERFGFVKWAQHALRGIRVIPPGYGILHQVNLEHLHPGLLRAGEVCFPDTLVGTDSHTCMIAGLSVVGWGVGGIEAQSALLGEPVTILPPDVVGVEVTGSIRPGVTSTDIVLYATELFRRVGVIGCFLEFFGASLRHLSVPDRATIANMAPEYGATIGFFPMDEVTVDYLYATGRPPADVRAAENYFRRQGWFGAEGCAKVRYTRTLTLDLSSIEMCVAGPRRPQDRLALNSVPRGLAGLLAKTVAEGGYGRASPVKPSTADSGRAMGDAISVVEDDIALCDGDVVLAAITSCANTSNPGVMLAAGLLAKAAVERGLKIKPWVKTSLTPGSVVVGQYLRESGLQAYLDRLGFQVAGYGCATCVGNSGPLLPGVEERIRDDDLVACAVLSGNRNFEGRIHRAVRAAYLASPPLVIAYALAGTMNIDLDSGVIATDTAGKPVYLRELLPSAGTLSAIMEQVAGADAFSRGYGEAFGEADAAWKSITTPTGQTYAWDEQSMYLREPPYFTDDAMRETVLHDVCGARVLLVLGDSITTDHISPIGDIAENSPAAKYLQDNGVDPIDFSAYGARRMNHEVMVRGAFANIRLRNKMVNKEGGVTLHHPDGQLLPVYEAALLYQREHVPMVVFAGKEYGTGSARDWAAKGTRLLGINAVIAESFEKIHRSNLVGMGVLPLQLPDAVSVDSLALVGEERIDIVGLDSLASPAQKIAMRIRRPNGAVDTITVTLRADTLMELQYLKRGGVLHYLFEKL